MLDVDPKEWQAEHVERAEPKLRQEQEELRQIVDLIPQTIVMLNPEGKAIYANRVALEYMGLALDEVRADNFRERVFHPDDIQRLREERSNAVSGAIPFENEQRARGKDGRYRWFSRQVALPYAILPGSSCSLCTPVCEAPRRT